MKLISAIFTISTLVSTAAAENHVRVGQTAQTNDGNAAAVVAAPHDRKLWAPPINPSYDLHCPCQKQAMAELAAALGQAQAMGVDGNAQNEDLARQMRQVMVAGQTCITGLSSCVDQAPTRRLSVDPETTRVAPGERRLPGYIGPDEEECCCDAETIKGAYIETMNAMAGFHIGTPDVREDYWIAVRKMVTEADDCLGLTPTV